jgi:hypothetical protein
LLAAAISAGVLQHFHCCHFTTTSTAAVLRVPGLQAACLLSACSLNDVLTGITFCGQDNNDVAAVAYDSDALVMWRSASA